MEISRDFSHNNLKEKAINEVAKDDLIASYLGESLDEKRSYKKKEKQGKNKSDNKQLDTLSIIEEKAEHKELLKDMAQKMGKKLTDKQQQWLRQNLQGATQQEIDKFLNNKTQESVNDSIQLSQQLSGELKKQKKKSETKNNAQKNRIDSNAAKALSALQSLAPSLKQKEVKEKNKIQNQQTSSKVTAQKQGQPREVSTKNTQTVLTQYLSAYSEALLGSKGKKSQVKKELIQLGTQLQKEGVSTKHIRHLESSVGKMIHKDLKKQLRTNFIDMALTYSKDLFSTDLMQNAEKFKHVQALATKTGVIKQGNGVFQGVREDAKSELRSFVADELDKTIIDSKVSGRSIREIVSEFDKFNSLIGISRFNTEEYMKKFQKKLDDLGLLYFESPEKIGVLDTESGGSNNSSQEKDAQNQKENDKIESLEDQIRTLYMLQVIKKDMKSQVDIILKLRKFKKGLSSMKKITAEDFELLKKEGHALARFRLSEMVKEALEERATLPQLKGPAYNIVRNKLKMGLSGLKKIGFAIPKKQLQDLRDTINRSMFSIIKEDYLKVELLLEKFPSNVKFIRQQKDYLVILERIQTETTITESMRPKMFQSHTFKSEKSIMEAA